MRSTLRSILAAAGLLTGLAAATVAVPASPAAAAACTGAGGVTVVVDPQQLGGGVQEVCDSGGAGKTAATIFEESGFHQTYANGGMVCQVNGAPAGDVCRTNPPADAYWSLWWSDGSTGWVYSSLGVGSLKIPAGGSVAWTWQGQSTKHYPSVAPAKASAPSPAPAKATHAAPKAAHATPKPQAQPKTASKPATTAPATPTPAASRSVSAGVSPSAVASRSARPGKVASVSSTLSAAAASSPSTSATPSAGAVTTSADPTPTSADSDGGVPGWIPPAIVAILAIAAGGIAYTRRRIG